MNNFVPKGNHSPNVRGTSSGPTPSSNGALVTGGELDDTAQIGADPTDQNATAGDLSGAGQLGIGYGYPVAPMLPGGDGAAIPNTHAGSNHPSSPASTLVGAVSPPPAAALVSAGPPPAPAPAQPSSNQNQPQPTVNQNQSPDKVIAPPTPTGSLQAPVQSVFYYFFDGADATVGFGGFNPGILVSTGAGAITGSGGITKGDAGTLPLSGSNTYSGGTTINAGTLNAVDQLNQLSEFGGGAGGFGAGGGGGVASGTPVSSNVGTTAGNEGTLQLSSGSGAAEFNCWSGMQTFCAVTGTAPVATLDVSTTTIVTMPLSLLNQFVAGELVTSSAGSLQTVTAQPAPASIVPFAIAHPKT
jgi:autotransporter-associated beta strand protein